MRELMGWKLDKHKSLEKGSLKYKRVELTPEEEARERKKRNRARYEARYKRVGEKLRKQGKFKTRRNRHG
jgi:hypothetical protein